MIYYNNDNKTPELGQVPVALPGERPGGARELPTTTTTTTTTATTTTTTTTATTTTTTTTTRKMI